jgi:uncharacterized protein YlxW (UPF0749 family)
MPSLTWRLAGMIGAPIAIILAIVLAVVTIQKNSVIGALRDDKAALTKSRDDALRDLTQCRANRITLDEAIRRQNSAVAAARAAGEARIAELDRLAAEARRTAASARARANSILSRQATGNACADAEALIRETLQ